MTQKNYTTTRIESDTLERLKIISWFYDTNISKIIEESLDNARYPDLEVLRKKKAERMNIKTPFD